MLCVGVDVKRLKLAYDALIMCAIISLFVCASSSSKKFFFFGPVKIAVHIFSVVKISWVLTFANISLTTSCLLKKSPWNLQHKPQHILVSFTGSKIIFNAMKFVAIPTTNPKAGKTLKKETKRSHTSEDDANSKTTIKQKELSIHSPMIQYKRTSTPSDTTRTRNRNKTLTPQ